MGDMNLHHTALNNLNQTVDMWLKPTKEVDFIILSDILMVGTCIVVPMLILLFKSVAEHIRASGSLKQKHWNC